VDPQSLGERAQAAGTAALQAVVDAYVVVFAGLLVAAGVLADRFGRRRALLVGLSVVGTASASAVAAGSVEWLIAMRAAMGIRPRARRSPRPRPSRWASRRALPSPAPRSPSSSCRPTARGGIGLTASASG
jgi:hypothetical protein